MFPEYPDPDTVAFVPVILDVLAKVPSELIMDTLYPDKSSPIKDSKFISKCEQDTIDFAKKFAKKLNKKEIGFPISFMLLSIVKFND